MSTGYRSDIDGLRALAILPVLLFHLQVSGFSGGFVGVDVFFVISGFLITGLIQQEISEGRFSYIQFWERRARRLLPPIVVVTAVTWLLAYQFFLPDQLKALGQSIVAITAFASNIFFWMTSGYFAAPEDSIPLLHTWSLAVEEQYYVVFPAVLLLLARRSATARLAAIAIIGLISLAISIWWVRSYPDAAYYLLPSRAWELMLGAGLALVRPENRGLSQRAANTLMLVGFTMVLVPVFLYSEHTPFPGIAAMLPCLGTLLIIRVGTRADGALHSLLTHPWTIYCGKLSYSLYLWHWPLIVLWKVWSQQEISEFSSVEVLALIVATVALSLASYHWVENPVRRRQVFASRPRIFAASGAAMAMIALVGVSAHISAGFTGRLPNDVRNVIDIARDWDARQLSCGERGVDGARSGNLCTLGRQHGEPQFVLWGDSHARAVFKVFDDVAHATTISAVHASHDACPPLPDVYLEGQPYTYSCPAFNEAVMDLIEGGDIHFVVLAARWSGYSADETLGMVSAADDATELNQAALFQRQMRRTLERLRAADVEVLVLDEAPYAPGFEPEAYALSLWRNLPLSSTSVALAEYDARNAPFNHILTELGVEHRISQAEAFCEAGNCPTVRNGLPLYRDSNHLTNLATRRLRGPISESLQPFARVQYASSSPTPEQVTQ